MAQYFVIVNLDKKQFINPNDFGESSKLTSFAKNGGDGTACALCILLANSNGRGIGDFESANKVVGSWAGDRIVVAGDYGDNGEFGGKDDQPLYSRAYQQFENISEKVIEALKEDPESSHHANENNFIADTEQVIKMRLDQQWPGYATKIREMTGVLSSLDMMTLLRNARHKGQTYLKAFRSWLLMQDLAPAARKALTKTKITADAEISRQ